MALTGTLSDMGMIDLIQFPNQGRRTGLLILTGQSDEARLYYRKGNLAHAVSGTREGQEVLISLVDWTEARFEFRPEVQTEATSIEMDLHRCLMTALKTRDERKLEQERLEAERQAHAKQLLDPALEKHLQDYLAANDWTLYVSVADGKGNTLAEARPAGGELRGMARLQAMLYEFAAAYPGEGLKRIFLEDQNSTVVLAKIHDELLLLAVAAAGRPLGVIAMSVGKLMNRLEAPTPVG